MQGITLIILFVHWDIQPLHFIETWKVFCVGWWLLRPNNKRKFWSRVFRTVLLRRTCRVPQVMVMDDMSWSASTRWFLLTHTKSLLCAAEIVTCSSSGKNTASASICSWGSACGIRAKPQQTSWRKDWRCCIDT